MIGGVGGVDGLCVRRGQVCFGERRLTRACRFLVPVKVGVRLQELNAAAVTVHIAKAADVHEDVESEAVACTEGSEKFVVTPAVPGPQPDEFGKAVGAEGGDVVAELSVGVVAVRIKK
jgi:hypothetical protein